MAYDVLNKTVYLEGDFIFKVNAAVTKALGIGISYINWTEYELEFEIITQEEFKELLDLEARASMLGIGAYPGFLSLDFGIAAIPGYEQTMRIVLKIVKNRLRIIQVVSPYRIAVRPGNKQVFGWSGFDTLNLNSVDFSEVVRGDVSGLFVDVGSKIIVEQFSIESTTTGLDALFVCKDGSYANIPLHVTMPLEVLRASMRDMVDTMRQLMKRYRKHSSFEFSLSASKMDKILSKGWVLKKDKNGTVVLLVEQRRLYMSTAGHRDDFCNFLYDYQTLGRKVNWGNITTVQHEEDVS